MASPDIILLSQDFKLRVVHAHAGKINYQCDEMVREQMVLLSFSNSKEFLYVPLSPLHVPLPSL